MSLKVIVSSRNINLRKYTSIKIGGKAKYFFEADTVDDICRIISDFDNSYYLLGGGSNLLIKDVLIDKPVIKLASAFNYTRKSWDCVEVGAAIPISHLLRYCLKNNLGGLENLAGIPATVGGALAMNVSSFGRDIFACLEAVEILDREGKIKRLNREQIQFGYRYSSLGGKIVLRAWFKFYPEKNIKTKINSFLDKRFQAQDFGFPSCGCIFKNPSSFTAGFLIDSCGLKGARRGDAQISSKHANFIVNLNRAKYEDVDYLICKIKDKVYQKHEIILEEEIKRWI
ncbi:MAG: UDP-N-acetylmuramate dehydrogenase [Candidatus Omnitrophica bacterium]|nr:UDP-N-acetylmuramate dehydrogenase [Candidatus Omnitrophota bacterium]